MEIFGDSTNVAIAKFVICYILAFIIIYIINNHLNNDGKSDKDILLSLIFTSFIGAGLLYAIYDTTLWYIDLYKITNS